MSRASSGIFMENLVSSCVPSSRHAFDCCRQYLMEHKFIADETDLEKGWPLTVAQTEQLLFFIQWKYAMHQQSSSAPHTFKLADLVQLIEYMIEKYPVLSQSSSLAQATLKKDAKCIECFCEKTQQEPDVIVSLLVNAPGLVVNHLNSPSIIAKAIKSNALVYKYLPQEFKNWRILANNAIMSCRFHPEGASVLADIPQDFWQEWGFANAAVVQRWEAFLTLPEKWKNSLLIQSTTVQSFFELQDMIEDSSLEKLLSSIDDGYWQCVDGFVAMLGGLAIHHPHIGLSSPTLANALKAWLEKACVNPLLKAFIEVMDWLYWMDAISQEKEAVEKMQCLTQDTISKFHAFCAFRHLNHALSDSAKKSKTNKI